MLGRPLPIGKRFDVVGVGLNAVDHLCTVRQFPTFDSKHQLAEYRCLPGGNVATALVALQRWGASTSYVGSFGDDPLAAIARDSLVAEGLDLRGSLVRIGVPNQLAVILVDASSGERTVLMHRAAALTIAPHELDAAVVTSGRVLHLDGYDLEAAIAAARLARAAGIPVVVDVDTATGPVERLFALTDAVIVSEELALAVTGTNDRTAALDGLARLSAAPVVAITLGVDGVVARDAAGVHAEPAFPVRAVDTTGAGDVFHAAFIHGLLQDWPLVRTLRFANAAAGLKCAAPGGRAGIPTVAAAEALAGRR